MKNLFKKIAILSIGIMVIGCSKDDCPTTEPTPANYSITGIWKTTSAVKNGVELFGGTNTIKSEVTYFYNQGNITESFTYSNPNYTNEIGSSLGTYTKSSNTLNMTLNIYNGSGALTNPNVSISSEITLLNANELQLKTINFPLQNDVYVKKLVRF